MQFICCWFLLNIQIVPHVNCTFSLPACSSGSGRFKQIHRARSHAPKKKHLACSVIFSYWSTWYGSLASVNTLQVGQPGQVGPVYTNLSAELLQLGDRWRAKRFYRFTGSLGLNCKACTPGRQLKGTVQRVPPPHTHTQQKPANMLGIDKSCLVGFTGQIRIWCTSFMVGYLVIFHLAV